VTAVAGLAVIAVGIGCLYLSDAVVHQAWWQGTLDAFGVGFVVGGIIDVLAISALNAVYAADQQRATEYQLQEANNQQAKAILHSAIDIETRVEAAKDFVIRNGRELDPDLYRRLVDFIDSNRPPVTTGTKPADAPEPESELTPGPQGQ